MTITHEPARHAIVMGIWDYPHEPDPRFRTVKGVEGAVADVLHITTQFGYQRQLAEISNNPGLSDLGVLETYFYNPAETKGAGILVLYISCHGSAPDGLHILQLHNYRKESASQATIATSTLGRWLAKSKYDATLLVVDACYAGASTHDLAKAVSGVLENLGSRMAVIATALTIEEAQGGVFAKAFAAAVTAATTTLKCGSPEAPYLSLEGLVDLTNQYLPRVATKEKVRPHTVRLLTLSDGVLPFFRRRPEASSTATLAAVDGGEASPSLTRSSDPARFEAWLKRLGVREPLMRDVLTAIAFGQGDGLPFDDILPTVTSAVGRREYSDAEIDLALRLSVGYVTVSVVDGRTKYKLTHESHAAHLRAQRDVPHTHAAIADALQQISPSLQWAHPYVRQHLQHHHAAAARAFVDRDPAEHSKAAPEEITRPAIRARPGSPSAVSLGLIGGLFVGSVGALGGVGFVKPEWASNAICDTTVIDTALGAAKLADELLAGCRDQRDRCHEEASARPPCETPGWDPSLNTDETDGPVTPATKQQPKKIILGKAWIATGGRIYSASDTIELRYAPASEEVPAKFRWLALVDRLPQRHATGFDDESAIEIGAAPNHDLVPNNEPRLLTALKKSRCLSGGVHVLYIWMRVLDTRNNTNHDSSSIAATVWCSSLK